MTLRERIKFIRKVTTYNRYVPGITKILLTINIKQYIAIRRTRWAKNFTWDYIGQRGNNMEVTITFSIH